MEGLVPFLHDCLMPNTRANTIAIIRAASLSLTLTVGFLLQAQTVAEKPWERELMAARALYDQGRYTEAEQSLEPVAKWAGEAAPAELHLAGLLGEIGGLYFELGRFEEGKLHLERSLLLWDQQVSRPESGRLRTVNQLIALYTETGRFSRAQKLGEDTLFHRRADLDRHPQELVHTLHNLATVYYFQGRYQEAERLLRDALATLEQLGIVEDSHAMYVLASMASVLVRNGKAEQALACARRSRSIGERIFGPQHVALARALVAESAACRQLKRTAEAEIAVKKALAIIPDTVIPLLQAAEDEYARVLWQSGRKREAKAVEKRAARIPQ
ncbi:MAG: tetratricopeptide repeat protein [Bryobacterales bacterium]|nr:tetratricopeptide repeat protein [Bryobacterales bacterium]